MKIKLKFIKSSLAFDHYHFDEMVVKEDVDFSDSGLKTNSVIRIGRIAVVQSDILVGAIGQISQERLL